MELPDDLLVLVRAFSKPILRYPGKYKEAIRVLNMSEWSMLKKHLSTPDAEKVVVSLNAFLAAFVERKEAFSAYTNYTLDVTFPLQDVQSRWIELNRLRDVYRIALTKQENEYRYLMIHAFGEDVAYQEELLQLVYRYNVY